MTHKVLLVFGSSGPRLACACGWTKPLDRETWRADIAAHRNR